MDDVIDLDAIAPKNAKLKIGGTMLDVPPPRTADVLALGGLGRKLQEVDALPAEDVDTLIVDLTALVYKMVPGLEELMGERQLGTAQFMKLIKMINDMAVPPDVKELDKLGITPLDPKAQA